MPRQLIPDPDQPKGSFECSYCQKGFKNPSELTRHENTHLKEKPHKCEVQGCGKTFSQRGQLSNHANTHTGRKPVICAFCDRGFAEGGSTGRHEREQHSNFAGFRCPVSGCKYINKRRDNFFKHMKSVHGVPKDLVEPWFSAYTTDNVKIDPTRNLGEQLKWEKFLHEGRGRSNRSRARQAAASLWKERQAAPAPRARSTRKRRAGEDEEDEGEYKPNTRARATKRMRRSAPEPEPEVKPTTPVAEGALNGLLTISPASDHGSDVGLPSASSSSLTSLLTTPEPRQGELQFTFDTYGCTSSEAGPSTPCGSHNTVLGLTVPDHPSAYSGYQSTIWDASLPDQSGVTGGMGLFMGQQVSHGFNEFNFDTGLYNGTFSYADNESLNVPSTQPQAYDNYLISSPNASPSLYVDPYQHQSLAPTLHTDLLSASSPLTASSQGTSRSPSPIGLVKADNGFGVPSISSLGRARAHAQLMMPQLHQDMAPLNGYTTSM